MRAHGAHLYKVTTRGSAQREAREGKGERAICQTAPISFLSGERESSIPEIGQKSNRIVDVNGNVGGVDPAADVESNKSAV